LSKHERHKEYDFLRDCHQLYPKKDKMSIDPLLNPIDKDILIINNDNLKRIE